MFYQKTLKRLRADLTESREHHSRTLDNYYETRVKNEELAGDLLRQEDEIRDLKSELERFHDINVALADESRDARQRLELLQDVLKQLQIPVKLPTRKR